MKKEMLGLIIFIIIMIAMFIYGMNRFDKINNGEMVQVSESYMK